MLSILWQRMIQLDHLHVQWWSTDQSHKSLHYDDVIMTMLASQITSLPVVCSIVYSDVNQRKHQSSASLAFVREIHRGPVNFPHKWPVTRKMFPFDDVIMQCKCPISHSTPLLTRNVLSGAHFCSKVVYCAIRDSWKRLVSLVYSGPLACVGALHHF